MEKILTQILKLLQIKIKLHCPYSKMPHPTAHRLLGDHQRDREQQTLLK